MARKPTARRARPRRRVVGLRVGGRIYRAALKPDLKVGGYTVRVPALPGCFTEGDTLAEAKRMAKELELARRGFDVACLSRSATRPALAEASGATSAKGPSRLGRAPP